MTTNSLKFITREKFDYEEHHKQMKRNLELIIRSEIFNKVKNETDAEKIKSMIMEFNNKK